MPSSVAQMDGWSEDGRIVRHVGPQRAFGSAASGGPGPVGCPERIDYIAINTVAFNKASDGTVRRPGREYIAVNVPPIAANISPITIRMRRSG